MNKNKLLLIALFSIIVLIFVLGLNHFNRSSLGSDINKENTASEEVEVNKSDEVAPVAADSESEELDITDGESSKNADGDEPCGLDGAVSKDEEPPIEQDAPVGEVGEVVEEPIEEVVTVTSPKVPEVQTPADKIETKRQTEEMSIAYKTVEVNDSSLEKGKSIVSINGKNGIMAITYELTYINGKLDSKKKISESIKVEPIDKVIKIGTKAVPTTTPTPVPTPQPIIKTYEDVKTESIAFKTEEREDNTLEEGQTKVVQEGVNGLKTYKYQVTTTDGKETARKLISEEITKQPVNKIVVRGTKKAETFMDTAARHLPSGFSFGPPAELFMGNNGLYKNGKIVGDIDFIRLNMYKSLSYSDQKSLAEYWVTFRSLAGRTTNKTDVLAVLDSYHNDGSGSDYGKIAYAGNQYMLSLIHR